MWGKKTLCSRIKLQERSELWERQGPPRKGWSGCRLFLLPEFPLLVVFLFPNKLEEWWLLSPFQGEPLQLARPLQKLLLVANVRQWLLNHKGYLPFCHVVCFRFSENIYNMLNKILFKSFCLLANKHSIHFLVFVTKGVSLLLLVFQNLDLERCVSSCMTPLGCSLLPCFVVILFSSCAASVPLSHWGLYIFFGNN